MKENNLPEQNGDTSVQAAENNVSAFKEPASLGAEGIMGLKKERVSENTAETDEMCIRDRANGVKYGFVPVAQTSIFELLLPYLIMLVIFGVIMYFICLLYTSRSS